MTFRFQRAVFPPIEAFIYYTPIMALAYYWMHAARMLCEARGTLQIKDYSGTSVNGEVSLRTIPILVAIIADVVLLILLLRLDPRFLLLAPVFLFARIIVFNRHLAEAKTIMRFLHEILQESESNEAVES